ncbi:MAG: hypothetical protein CMC67_00235 [Flavobacteriaceae bacterium]|jgi:hypothetical protein|nr:hypothetical protein [Flavobacteriaceae bacterium]|tara:strand:- start:411 stop:860 length:450 start_codon:yes stop_codon:yes gene_type:complete
MNFQNIIKIISGILGVLGAIFLLRIMSTGDDQIKMDASLGDFSIVTPLIMLAIFILSIAVLVTIIFSLRSLAANKNKLKKSLLMLGIFIFVIAISYGISDGVETPLKDGEILSANGSRWVGTGIRVFYILTVVAFVSMIFSSVKKLISR